ncbi:MAG TPA: protein kinase [Terriglobia bacterium]|jgi:hypothetical protein
MPITPGTRIGPYEITSALGEGGMGVVFRARDVKLQRDVAIKLLPDDFMDDADRLLRFKREAQVLASLNHPNVAQIYGFEESGSTRCIVMELVEGETLSERIASGPIPVEDALPIAAQIAEGLEAAHERGVIHRDLKPANIKLTPDGKVKVLDFGLAKPLQEQEATSFSHSPTMMTASVPGMILGTPAYLSPEQARGKAVDKRTDIWAFGCVLFEMLTGRQAFGGETIPDIMASIISRDVSWQDLPATTPPRLRELMARCLQKDVRRRLRDAGDARLAIEDIIRGLHSPPPAAAEAAAGRTAKRPYLSLILAAMTVALAAAVVWLAMKRPAETAWLGTRLGGPNIAGEPRVSPDGRLVAFVALVEGTSQVGVIHPDSGDWTILTHDRSHGYPTNVAWSPDSTRIYYGRIDGSPRGVFSVPALGGSERLVLDDAANPEVLPDGSLLVARINPSRHYQLYRFWPETGRVDSYPAMLVGSDSQTTPAFKDGKEALFWGIAADQPDSKNHLYTVDLNTKTTRRIMSNIDLDMFSGFVPKLAVSKDDRFILVAGQAGDLQEIIEIPRTGGDARTLISTTNFTSAIDAGPDGSIYLDQLSRPFEMLQLASASAVPEQIVHIDAPTPDFTPPPIADGRVIVQAVVGGRGRLLLGKPGTDLQPFIQTSEETSGPIALAGTDAIAFVIGSGASRQIAIASIADGRILRRLTKVDGSKVSTLAASADGKALYYTIGDHLWTMPAEDGEPRMMGEAGSVGVDPHGKYLVVERSDKEGIRLVRMPLDGGAETPLSFPGVRLVYFLTPNAIRADGAILMPLAVGSFNWAAGLLHPESGKVDKLPIDPSFDVHAAGFLPDGRIQVAGFGFNSTLWRFRPQAPAR